ARPTVVELRDAIRSLRAFPNRGRKGREDGTRELVHHRLPFIIVYRTKEDVVEILHIWHSSQDRQ
ncbi:MAG TPA: type II toxin-antitoxin system RelE/ParE family toxin, partial [Allosphingosinicella sp.]|nr:type II toxin-antitoxin system RelE/ParE family toxin [Allosphingosinicella sp.]